MSTAEEIEVERRIAERMRGLRRSKGLTLAEVAQQAGLSPGHLSRIESGARQPSIGTLVLLARALGATLADLLAEDDGDPVIVRGAAAQAHRRPEGLFASLSGRLEDGALEVIRLDLDPEAGKVTTKSHPGEEWVYVLSGVVTLELGTSRHSLDAGDAAHFRGEQAHRMRCSRPATVLIVIAAPSPHSH
ncbi:helix-turn-helix domain-containing protein [Nonomuraea lactucae]|uniref:helix-turn-helix domain-containing protein n=1 Tax=Nonomuraea lactucae TaxID=2249762 RepID=UPI0013B37F8E|nr:XRE family transcriptional regulator [Nonomuraea lactucae]